MDNSSERHSEVLTATNNISKGEKTMMPEGNRLLIVVVLAVIIYQVACLAPFTIMPLILVFSESATIHLKNIKLPFQDFIKHQYSH